MFSFQYFQTAFRMGLAAFRDGRLPLSPSRWMLDLRHLYQTMSRPAAEEHAPSTPPEPPTETVRAPEEELTNFLATNERIAFAVHAHPVLSILLVVFNRADLTLRCLRSIASHVPVPFEVVVVDNASTDSTSSLLDRIEGIRVQRSGVNEGFLVGANRAASLARGEFLLFLNNDVELHPQTIASALAVSADSQVGVVGGKLVFPDGRLQEAGSIIWRDGSCSGYGRHDAPDKAEYTFPRKVDFVSGAFLLTRRSLFETLGGFDLLYEPAYYEDADYCVRVWQAGFQVVYEPLATVTHAEFGSSSLETATALQTRNRVHFANKHSEWLLRQYESGANPLIARSRSNGLRILFIDDRMPASDIGFGFPRALDLLDTLLADGHTVTLFATDVARTANGPAPRMALEVVADRGWPGVADFFQERRGTFDVVLVSRPHNMDRLRAKFGHPESWLPPAKVIYDAEAISAFRDAGYRQLAGEAIDPSDLAAMIDREVALTAGTSGILAVSQSDRVEFSKRSDTAVQVASFSLVPNPTPADFSQRHDFLFVGSFDITSPNGDSVWWFAEHVLPAVRGVLGRQIRLLIVGRHAPPDIRRLQGDDVQIFDDVVDLFPFYNRVRVFVAPTRFAAGLPYKVAHAAAHGVPIVCTTLLQRQLQWKPEVDLLAADTAADFASACVTLHEDRARWQSLRESALRRVATDYSPDRFRHAVRAALA